MTRKLGHVITSTAAKDVDAAVSEQLIECCTAGAGPIVIQPDVGPDNRREVIEGAVGMDDTEIIQSVLILGFERLTERMEDSLECIVVPRSKKLASDNMGITDIPSRMDFLVVIRVAMIDVGSWIGHATPRPT